MLDEEGTLRAGEGFMLAGGSPLRAEMVYARRGLYFARGEMVYACQGLTFARGHGFKCISFHSTIKRLVISRKFSS